MGRGLTFKKYDINYNFIVILVIIWVNGPGDNDNKRRAGPDRNSEEQEQRPRTDQLSTRPNPLNEPHFFTHLCHLKMSLDYIGVAWLAGLLGRMT